MHRHVRSRFTRRAIFGAGLGLGLGAPHTTFGQATPGASPVAGDDYAHPEMLVDIPWLEANGDDPPVILVGFMPADDFAQGFIPNSVQIDWPDLEVTDTTNDSLAAWQVEVERKLTNLGISRESTVVAYDEGSLFAARMWWVLHYLGHTDVRVLDGGLPAWQAAGHELEVDAPEPPNPADVPYRGDAQPDVIAQVAEVEVGLDDDGVVIVDARTADEYAEGHIPGAVNVNYPLNALPEPPKFWKPAGELKRLYGDAGVTTEKHVIPYCSTGVRSAVTCFSLRLIGHENVSLFTGSWAEWTSYPELPITTGDMP